MNTYRVILIGIPCKEKNRMYYLASTCWVYNKLWIQYVQVKITNILQLLSIYPCPHKIWVLPQFRVGETYIFLHQRVITIHHTHNNNPPLIYFLLIIIMKLPPPPPTCFSPNNLLGTCALLSIYLYFLRAGIS